MLDLLIRNGKCLTPNGLEKLDILVKEGTIVDMAEEISAPNLPTIDANGLTVLPGLIDSQVHLREPGPVHKEDLETGTKSAVAGGITAVCEMPNTNPSTTSKEALDHKLQRAAETAWTDYAFFVGGTPDRDMDWEGLESLPGCAGIKIFMGSSTGSLLVAEDEAIRRILEKTKRRVAVHCEDEQRLIARQDIAKDGADPKYHPIWRDEQTALQATQRLISIARETGAKVQVLHVTTAEEMKFLAEHKDVATVEILPQHLTFTADDYEELGTRIQMNPPIRDKRHRPELWKAVRQGVVDVMGSDHAPHTSEEKSKTYPESPSGMPGLQTTVPLMLDHVANGQLSLERMVDLLAYGPAKAYGMKKRGRIAVGYYGSFTIVDLNATTEVRDDAMHYKCGWTPYHGRTFKGKVTHTVVRGQIAYTDGALQQRPEVQPIDYW